MIAPLLPFRRPSPPLPDFQGSRVTAPTRAASPPPPEGSLASNGSQVSLSSHGSGDPAAPRGWSASLEGTVWGGICLTGWGMAIAPGALGLGVLGLMAVLGAGFAALALCRCAAERRAARELLDGKAA